MNTSVILYRIGLVKNRGELERLRVAFAWTSCSLENEAIVSVPRLWSFKIPSQDGFTLQKLGASETRGLFGGAEDPRRSRLSDACERAIGEVLITSFCEVVGQFDEQQSLVVILGPALPKAVGRLASLRPDPKIRVIWLCPLPLPTWIAEGADTETVIPRYLEPQTAPGEDWEDESLVQGIEVSNGENRYVVQRLAIWDAGHNDVVNYWTEIQHRLTGWEKAEALGSVSLPREIRLAAKLIDRHWGNRQRHSTNGKLAPSPSDLIDEAFGRLAVEVIPSQTGLDSFWSFRWKEGQRQAGSQPLGAKLTRGDSSHD